MKSMKYAIYSQLFYDDFFFTFYSSILFFCIFTIFLTNNNNNEQHKTETVIFLSCRYWSNNKMLSVFLEVNKLAKCYLISCAIFFLLSFNKRKIREKYNILRFYQTFISNNYLSQFWQFETICLNILGD